MSDVQAEAILNMRLRSLRKLEEMEIRNEHEKLTTEKKEIKNLIGSNELQWEYIATELKELKSQYGLKTKLGKRRTDFGDVVEVDLDEINEAMIEKETNHHCGIEKRLDSSHARNGSRFKVSSV